MKFCRIKFNIIQIFSIYSCDCQAVSETFYVPYRSWEISSCKFCSCNDVAMTNCETACKAVVENYALTGCGKATKGSQVRYSFKASSCKSARSNDVYTCS